MQTINISDFRANLLKYLELANSGEQVAVTTNGKILATVTPPINQREQAKTKLKALRKSAKIHDVVSPTGEDWSSMA